MKVLSEIRKITDGAYMFNTIENIDEGRYTLDIKKYRKNRTVDQNALMWEMIRKIVIEETGGYTERDGWNMYMYFLRQAGAGCFDVMINDDDVKRFYRFNRCRLVVEINYDVVTKTHVFRCFPGSSRLDTKGMGTLIDVILDYASNLGIYTLEWEELWNEQKHSAG